MVTTPLEEFFSLQGELDGLRPPSGLLVASRRSPNEQRPQGNDALHVEMYERYEPVKLIYVFMEPAATSPFMDA
jgi:hypothetical protein